MVLIHKEISLKLRITLNSTMESCLLHLGLRKKDCIPVSNLLTDGTKLGLREDRHHQGLAGNKSASICY